MKMDDMSGRKRNQRRGKFTEGLLDIDAILKALDVTVGQTILDAGCGTGYMANAFAGRVSPTGKVFALDWDEHFMEELRRQAHGTLIEAVSGDITESTRFEPSSMDLIYISTVVHAFSQPQMTGFIQEASRLLKPDATLAIVEIEKKETPFGPPLAMRYAPQELKDTIPMAPGKTIQVGGHFYMQTFRNRIK